MLSATTLAAVKAADVARIENNSQGKPFAFTNFLKALENLRDELKNENTFDVVEFLQTVPGTGKGFPWERHLNKVGVTLVVGKSLSYVHYTE